MLSQNRWYPPLRARPCGNGPDLADRVCLHSLAMRANPAYCVTSPVKFTAPLPSMSKFMVLPKAETFLVARQLPQGHLGRRQSVGPEVTHNDVVAVQVEVPILAERGGV